MTMCLVYCPAIFSKSISSGREQVEHTEHRKLMAVAAKFITFLMPQRARNQTTSCIVSSKKKVKKPLKDRVKNHL